jgi:hypothetical protein
VDGMVNWSDPASEKAALGSGLFFKSLVLLKLSFEASIGYLRTGDHGRTGVQSLGQPGPAR